MARNFVRGGASFAVDTTLARRDIDAFRRNLRKTDRRAAARPAAKFVHDELAKPGGPYTPEHRKNHYYYRNAKRQPGGVRFVGVRGPIVPREKVIIRHGNLRKSTKIMTFNKSPNLHVGPRYLSRDKMSGLAEMGRTKGTSSGYYARWVVEGKNFSKRPNDYMTRARKGTRGKALKLLEQNWTRALGRIASRSFKRGITRWQQYV